MAFNFRIAPKLAPKFDAYPYQIDAVEAVKDLPYSAIFHEQGLGKTKIAIDVALYWLARDVVDTVFIVTKKTLVQNWCDELLAHSHVSPTVLGGNKSSNMMALNSPVLIYVMHYEALLSEQAIFDLFLQTCKVGAILDESHKIKNPEAKLTEAFMQLGEKFHRRIIMTGTPVANRPFDIWSQVKFLDNGCALGESFDRFRARMDIPDDRDGMEGYADNLSSIHEALRPFSVRETKKSSGIDLPEKSICTRIVDMEPKQALIYDDYKNRLCHELVGDDGEVVADNAESILKRLLRLVQCASNPHIIDGMYDGVPAKHSELLRILEDEVGADQKVVIWTSFIKNVDWLASRLEAYNPVRVHGSLSIERRNNAIRRFKGDQSCRLFIATPGAAKEGLTLTVANHAVFYDRSFSLDDYLQAQDRIHRISQTQMCFVYNVIARGTIDEWVGQLLHAKYQAAQMAQNDIDSKEFQKNFECNLSEMLKQVLSVDAQPARSNR